MLAQLSYRSRQNPKQLPDYIPVLDAVTEHGVYHTMLGPLRMAECHYKRQSTVRMLRL